MRSFPRTLRALSPVILAAALIAPAPVRAADPVTLSVDSPPLTMTLLDMREEGPSLGDIRVFHAPAVASDGRMGTRWFTSITHDEIDAQDPTEDRFGLLVLDFGADSLVLAGVTSVDAAGAMLTTGAPLRRAILGGTGAFAGIRGEAVTTRNEDGSYHDELTILGLGMTEVTETLRYTTAGGARSDLDMDVDGAMGAGDLRVIDLPFSMEDGAAGRSLGVHLGMGIPDDERGGRPQIGLLVNDFGNGDKLFAAGISFVAEDRRPPIQSPLDRAIIGGTGRFAGARGTLTSTHVGDGVVEYVATLLAGTPDGAATGMAPIGEGVSVLRADEDLRDDGVGLGDLRVWQGPLTVDGRPGITDGLYVMVAEPTDADPIFRRLGFLAFRLDDGSQLIVAGTGEFDESGDPIALDVPLTRAVVGGTGDFLGASGTLTITRVGDDAFLYAFDLVE